MAVNANVAKMAWFLFTCSSHLLRLLSPAAEPDPAVERGAGFLAYFARGGEMGSAECHAFAKFKKIPEAVRYHGLVLRTPACRCFAEPVVARARRLAMGSSRTPSRASRRCFERLPPKAEKPPILRPWASTLWQGTTIATGLRASAWPTARAAPGEPMRSAISP